MKNKKSTIVKQEMSKPFEDKSFINPKDIDTPKPDGEGSSTSEKEDEDEKPGENIFK